MKKLLIITPVLFLIATISGCSGSKKSNQSEEAEMNTVKQIRQPGPPAIVYKTKKDYFNNVPVMLSDDKTTVVSYPDPNDLMRGGMITYPDKLNNGYLLDNRGISENAAFLNITYKEYTKLSKAPGPEEIKVMILDDDPFLEIYDCGLRSSYENAIEELNKKINEGALSEFQQLK